MPFQAPLFFSSTDHESSPKVPVGKKNKACFNSKMLGSAFAIFQKSLASLNTTVWTTVWNATKTALNP